jgi:hypothetical protein
MEINMRKPGRIPTKPLSLEPYLEILREQVTGNKKGSVRKYTRMKIKRLTGQSVKASRPKPQPC